VIIVHEGEEYVLHITKTWQAHPDKVTTSTSQPPTTNLKAASQGQDNP
jgi:hypothetical protein